MGNFTEQIRIVLKQNFSKEAEKMKKSARQIKKELRAAEKQADRTGKGFGRLGKTVLKTAAKIGRAAGRIQKSFHKIKKGMKGAIGSAPAKAAAAVGGVFAIKKMATDVLGFEQQQKIFKARTGGDTKAASSFALEQSKKLGLPASEILSAQTEVGSAKASVLKEVGGLQKIMEPVLKLSKITGVASDRLGVALTTVMNQFNLGADEANRIAEIMAIGQKEGKGTIIEIASALKQGSALKALGLSARESIVASEFIMGKGISAEETATSTRNFFAVLLKEGISVHELGMEGAIAEAKKRVAHLKGEDLATELMKVYKVEAFAAAENFLGDAAEFSRLNKAIIFDPNNSELDRAINIIMSSTIEKLKVLMASLNGRIIGAFEELVGSGEVQKMLDEIGRVIREINTEKVKDAVMALVNGLKLMAELLPELMKLTTNANLVLGVITGDKQDKAKIGSRLAEDNSFVGGLVRGFQEVFIRQARSSQADLNVVIENKANDTKVKANSNSSRMKLRAANMMDTK